MPAAHNQPLHVSSDRELEIAIEESVKAGSKDRPTIYLMVEELRHRKVVATSEAMKEAADSQAKAAEKQAQAADQQKYASWVIAAATVINAIALLYQILCRSSGA